MVAFADNQVDSPPHCLRKPRPHLALAPAGARKSSSYLFDSYSAGGSIPIDPRSVSASTIAWYTKKGPWAWLHSPRLPCAFEMKKCFYYFKERCFDFCLLPSSSTGISKRRVFIKKMLKESCSLRQVFNPP